MKTDYMSGIDTLAVKISPGIFENASVPGLSTSGTTVDFSTEKGMLDRLLLGNDCVTNVRTLAAGTLASDNRNASVASDCSAGVQARLRHRALAMVRSLREAGIWVREVPTAQTPSWESSDVLGFPVARYAQRRDAVEGAHVFVTTSSAAGQFCKPPGLSSASTTSGRRIGGSAQKQSRTGCPRPRGPLGSGSVGVGSPNRQALSRTGSEEPQQDFFGLEQVIRWLNCGSHERAPNHDCRSLGNRHSGSAIDELALRYARGAWRQPSTAPQPGRIDERLMSSLAAHPHLLNENT